MLNISLKRIVDAVDTNAYKSFKIVEARSVSQILLRLMLGLLIVTIIALFLPWTQNIRAKGYVTTLNPDARPQAVQGLIGGRIEKWHVREGDLVNVGDTILTISESKQEYFDPNLLENTENQIKAKSASSEAYTDKTRNLNDQLEALINTRKVKLSQNDIKRQQVLLKIQSDSLELIAAETKEDIAEKQVKRIQQLNDEGIKSLTALEAKKLSVREAQAKTLSYVNKINEHRNELLNLKADRLAIINEYGEKIAKTRSEINSTLSNKFDTDATINKLESDYNAYERRAANYVITSPIKGLITKAVTTGLGEMVKDGEDIVTIVPIDYDLAIEMYVEPQDMPLLRIGQKVRVQFDGWPAIVFSGWPNSSYGTFGGKVFAIDNFISDNGKYRILVSEDEEEQPWPREVRVGGGANTITLLNDVKVGYELWRQLNGFPADYYDNQPLDDVKSKAPLKKVK